jgi:hypothetical protein
MEIGPLEYVIIGMSDEQLTQTPENTSSTNSEILAQLKLLGELHDSGVLTDEEFAREKSRILNR